MAEWTLVPLSPAIIIGYRQEKRLPVDTNPLAASACNPCVLAMSAFRVPIPRRSGPMQDGGRRENKGKRGRERGSRSF